MDNQTELSAVTERRMATAAFYGYRRQKRVPAGWLTEDRNMTTDEYPAAMVRQQRRELYNRSQGYEDGSGVTEGRELTYVPFDGGYRLADALYVDGAFAYLFGNTKDDELYAVYKDRFWAVGTAAKPEKGRLLAYGNGLFSVTRGQYIPNRAVTADNEDQYGGADFPVIPVTALCYGDYLVSPVDAAGEAITPAKTQPQDPAPGDYWYRNKTEGLYIYTTDGWIPAPVWRIKVTPRQREQDGAIAGETDAAFAERLAAFRTLQAGGSVLFSSDETKEAGVRIHAVHFGDAPGLDGDYIVLDTVVDLDAADEVWTLQIARRYPALDYAVVCGNRIFGCKYAKSHGETNVINEIYVSRLGDPLTWYGYNGLEEDSFTFTVGEPGAWTGAAVLNGNPVFFKEHCMVTIYGSSPSSYTAVTTLLDGVEAGSDRSLAGINGSLYYKSRRGIMRMEAGGYPVCLSDALNRKDVWEDAVGGTDGRKYYVEMTDKRKGSRTLYVYDTELGMWHREDATGAVCMARIGSELLAAVNSYGVLNKSTVTLLYVSAPDAGELEIARTYLAELLEPQTASLGEYRLVPPWEEDYPKTVYSVYRETEPGGVTWQFATGDFGHVGDGDGDADTTAYKRVKEIDIRLWAAKGAEFDVYIMYDQDGEWRKIHTSDMVTDAGTRRVKYPLRRCDLYRLGLTGRGSVCVYSIAHVYEGAGDRSYGTV